MENIFEYKLSRPVEYNGKTVEKLAFNLDKLTGRDALDIERELYAKQRFNDVIVPALSSDYIIGVAVRCCSTPIGADIFDTMSIKDYSKIKVAVRRFLQEAE